MTELVLGIVAFVLILEFVIGIIIGAVYMHGLIRQVNYLGEDVVALNAEIRKAIEEMNNPKYMVLPKGLSLGGPGGPPGKPTPESGSYL